MVIRMNIFGRLISQRKHPHFFFATAHRLKHEGQVPPFKEDKLPLNLGRNSSILSLFVVVVCRCGLSTQWKIRATQDYSLCELLVRDPMFRQ